MPAVPGVVLTTERSQVFPEMFRLLVTSVGNSISEPLRSETRDRRKKFGGWFQFSGLLALIGRPEKTVSKITFFVRTTRRIRTFLVVQTTSKFLAKTTNCLTKLPVLLIRRPSDQVRPWLSIFRNDYNRNFSFLHQLLFMLFIRLPIATLILNLCF